MIAFEHEYHPDFFFVWPVLAITRGEGRGIGASLWRPLFGPAICISNFE
jgi:hypothetical protein